MSVEQKGRLIYIDPTNINDNATNGYPSPLEDYYIYVDLEIIKKDRYACGQPDSSGKSETRTFRAVEGNKSFFKGTNGVLTTNFTEVNPLNPDENTDECLGVKSITIDYTSWQCPQATIVFTDVRGTSLMGKNEGYVNGTATKPSFFNDLFMMPYPLFRLTVKGFYGNAVSYNLSLKDTAITLDSSTGNFDVTASFVGYMYGPMADVPMTLLVVAPYVNYDGKNIWDELVASGHFAFLNGDKDKVPMIRFPELRLKLAQLAENEEYVNSEQEKENRINDLNERKTQLEELINEYPFNGWNEPENDTFLFTVKTGETDESEKGSSNTVKNLSKKINDYYEKVKKYDNRYQTTFSATYSSLENGKGLKCAYTYIIDPRKRVFGHSMIESTGGGNHNYSAMDYYVNNAIVKEYLNKIEADNSISKYRFYVYDKDGETFFDNGKSLKEELAQINGSLEKVDEEYRDVTNQITANFLGFPPTIRNFYNMVFAHFETLARLIYGVLGKISEELNNNSEVRKPSYYGLTITDTDISQSLGNPYMAPFTAMYSNNEDEGQTKRELLWAGELTRGNELDEVGLVNAIVDAARLYTTREYQIQKLIESSSSEDGASINGDITEFIPLTYYDFANFGSINNPYYSSVSAGRDGSEIDPQMLSTFALRCYYYLLGNDGEKVKEGRAFGVLEALNVYKAFGNDINGSFINFYKKYVDKESYGDFWHFLNRVDEWNFLRNPVMNGVQYGWFKKDRDKVVPVGEYSLTGLQTAFNNDPEKNPDKRFINITHLEKNAGNFYLFQSKDYIRDIVDNLSKTNFGEFEDDFEVYKKEKVIRNLANNMGDEYKGNMWIDRVTYNTGLVREKKDDGKLWSASEGGLLTAMKDGSDNYFFVEAGSYGGMESLSLMAQPFYHIQKDIKAKAYLFVFGLPYVRNGKNGGIPQKTENGVQSLIELLREGAVYWREEEDLIATSGSVNISFGLANVSGKYEYKKAALNEIYMRNGTTYGIPMGRNEEYQTFAKPQGTNNERIKVLKEMFVKWAENEYAEMDSLFVDEDIYDFSRLLVRNNEIRGLLLNAEKGMGGGVDSISKKCERIQKLMRETAFGLRTVIDTTDGITQNKPVWTETFHAAFNGFCEELKKIYEKQIINNEVPHNSRSAIEDAFKDKDIRLSTYLVLKNLYDRWFCGTELDKWILNVDHNELNLDDYNEGSSFFDKFIYIDAFYHDLGNRLLANGSKIFDILSKSIPSSEDMKSEPTSTYQGMSIYKYLTDIAVACDGQLLSVPMFYGTKNAEKLEQMFEALPLSRTTKEDNSAFVFLYFYQPSQYLNTNHGYRYDGIDLTDGVDMIPQCLKDGDNKKGNIIPAFGVTFAKQNQSFFKSISLNTEQPQTSEIGLFATMDIASKAAESPRETTIYGQDVYRIMSSNSYECTVEMMGDAQVLPLMYFQLNGIPLWHGAYMIIQVSHNLTPGNMVTTFKGLKLSKNALPLSEGSTITLNSTAMETTTETYLEEEAPYITGENEMNPDLSNCADNAAAAYKVWNYVFNVLRLGESGKCAKYVYQLAKAFVGYKNVRFGSNGDQAGGNANQTSYWNNLIRLGYTRTFDKLYGNEVKSTMMKSEIAKLNAQPGDVVVYFATKPEGTNDSAVKYGHTQFFVGGKVGWTSSIKDNYSNGTSFVYNSKTGLSGWRLIMFCAPKANSVKE